MASRRRKLPSGSGPPSRTAMEISRPSLVNTWPLLASVWPFALLILDHLLCPDIPSSFLGRRYLIGLAGCLGAASTIYGIANRGDRVNSALESVGTPFRPAHHYRNRCSCRLHLW